MKLNRLKYYPDSPAQWDDPRFTLYREFHFRSTPDIEILLRLVKENMSDRGNEGYTKARLVGILQSYNSRLNRRFWLRQKHSITWKLIYHLQTVYRSINRFFNLKQYRCELLCCQLIRDIIKEEKTQSNESRTKTI